MVINLRDPHHAWSTYLAKGFDAPPLCLVRPWPESDREELRSLLMDGRLYAHIRDLDDEKEGVSWIDQAFLNRHYRFFSIFNTEDLNRVGFMVFEYVPGKGVRAGAAVSAANWNKGFVTSVIYGLKSFVKSSNLPFPIYAEVQPDNLAAQRAFEKSGCTPSPAPFNHNQLTYIF